MRENYTFNSVALLVISFSGYARSYDEIIKTESKI
jgi:hypothetical protein